jgi:hypothetical protein
LQKNQTRQKALSAVPVTIDVIWIISKNLTLQVNHYIFQ